LKAEKSTQHHAPPAPAKPSLAPAKIHEIDGDLFADAPADTSFAHCVGADFSMGAGVAIQFKNKFGQVAYLKSLNLSPGQVACLPVPDVNDCVKYVLYLVTKPRSARCRPDFRDFRSAVNEMATLCRSLGISTLALPRIGAGLDHLWWPQVLEALQEAFRGVNTDVLVFDHPAGRPQREQMSRFYSTVAATAATPQATRQAATRRSPPRRQAPRRQQWKPADQRVSPSDRLANDIRKSADRGSATRTEFNARARKGGRYVQSQICTNQSHTTPLCPAKPSEAQKPKLDDAASPVPGRGSAPKAAAVTADAAKGGSERSTEACELAGAPSPSALSPTPQTSGEPVPLFPPEASPAQGAQNAVPEVNKHSRSVDLNSFFINLAKPAEPTPSPARLRRNSLPTPSTPQLPTADQSRNITQRKNGGSISTAAGK
jgi:O-acetyl-ADP-ribose deacetylase (regulator of RNase III)